MTRFGAALLTVVLLAGLLTGAASAASATPGVCTDDNAFVNSSGDRYLWIDDTTANDWGNTWGNGGMGIYYANADMWGANGYDVWQKSVFCDKDSWYADIDADNHANDGAIKSYPNTHVDYHNWATGEEPLLSTFPTLTSSYAHQSPTGDGLIYDWAYDIWLNQYNIEVMIWTEAKVQHPNLITARYARNVKIGHEQWDLYVWNPGGRTVLFWYPTDSPGFRTSATMNLRAFLSKLQQYSLVPTSATLAAVAYGVEVVSTGNTPQRFDVTNFAVSPLPPG